MARLSRAEIFDPSEIAAVHTIAKTVRCCYLLGDDHLTGKKFDHRKQWFEDKLKQLAANFGIDLLAFACLSNHFHLVLRSRPDVVATWDDTEVARRWWSLCPKRKVKHEVDGQSIWIPAEPTEWDLNLIRKDPVLLAAIRLRLSYRMPSVEERLDELEKDVRILKLTRAHESELSAKKPGWTSRVEGSSQGDPDFEEILRLGREERKSDRLNDE